MILLFLAALQVKHVAADFFLQSEWMVAGKGRYGHPGGLAHSGLHSLASFAILLGFGVPVGWALTISLAEMAAHYHIDWVKDRITARNSLTPDDKRFWQAMGLDQCAHQMTYLAMAALVAGSLN